MPDYKGDTMMYIFSVVIVTGIAIAAAYGLISLAAAALSGWNARKW